MSDSGFSKTRGYQQIAPVGSRELNGISQPIEIATTQFEHGETKAVHISGIEVTKQRQVISAFFDEDPPNEVLIRWSKEQGQAAFALGSKWR